MFVKYTLLLIQEARVSLVTGAGGWESWRCPMLQEWPAAVTHRQRPLEHRGWKDHQDPGHMVGKMNVDFEVAQAWFVSSWINTLTSLCLCFFISKMGTVILTLEKWLQELNIT